MTWTTSYKSILFLTLILLISSSTMLFANHQEPVRVLLLYPFSQQRKWRLDFEKGYYDTIKQNKNIMVNTYAEYIEMGLIEDDISLEHASERMGRILDRTQPDIIVSTFSSLHDFIVYYEDGLLFDRTNIFVPSLPSRTEQLSQNPNLYLIESSSVSAMQKTILDIETFIPGLSDLIVICGSGNDDLMYLSVMKDIIADIDPAYTITYLTGLSLEELKKEIFVLPDKTAILYMLINRDKYGKAYFEELLFPELTDAADAPVFTFHDTSIGKGITGGRVTSARAYGRQTAETITRILTGEESPQTVSQGIVTPTYDWRLLDKWDIDEDILPEGNKVLFKTESFFEKYRKQIILIASFILLETILIILLVMNLISRKRTEQMLLNSEDLLQRSETTARLGGWDFYPQTESLSYTREVLTLLGLEPTDTLHHKDIEKLIHPDDLEIYRKGIDDAVDNGNGIRVEFRVAAENTHENWVELNCIAIKAGDKVVRISGTIQDISERKAYEQEIKDSLRQKDILLQEVHHRVKNNIAIITSLLSIQSEYIKNSEAKKILLDSSNRINTLALVYEQIYISDYIETINIYEYIKQLVGDLLNQVPPNINPISIQYNIVNMNINIDQMIPIGLIINEAVYNSLKHAFAGIEKPEISISTDYSIEDKKYSIQIKDNGCGITDIEAAGKGTTLGFLLIKTLAEQINGEIEIKNNNGLDITITFIISEI